MVLVQPKKVSISEAEEIVSSYTLETELWLRSKVGRLRGVRINDLSPLWPCSYLRDELMKGAKMMTADLEKKGLYMLTPESDVKVWGPIKSRLVDWRTQAYSGTGDVKTYGRQAGETLFGAFVEFRFRAKFLARHGYRNDN